MKNIVFGIKRWWYEYQLKQRIWGFTVMELLVIAIVAVLIASL
jgi:type II secretory pathway component PulJ